MIIKKKNFQMKIYSRLLIMIIEEILTMLIQ